MKKKIIHKGYYSDVYLLQNGKKKILKVFREKEQFNRLEDTSLKTMYNRELSGIRHLNSVQQKSVHVPNILSVNKKNLSFTQTYINMTSFNRTLSCSFFQRKNYLYQLVYGLGEYLAQLHKKGFQHGDLNHKNIGFTNNKIVLFDPSYVQRHKQNSMRDIVQVIFNFYPYNILAGLLFPNRDHLINSFLDGYEHVTRKQIPKKKLQKECIDFLIEHKKLKHGNSPSYFIKFQYMLFIDRILIYFIKRKTFTWLK